MIIYFALWLSALRASFSSYWKHYKKLSGTDFWEIFSFSRFLLPLTAEFRKMRNSWGILLIWAFCGFCVPEAPKISKIIKYKQIMFRTVFSNGFNSLKMMLYVPIVTRQNRLSCRILGSQNKKSSIFSIAILVTVHCMGTSNFRNYGFEMLVIITFTFWLSAHRASFSDFWNHYKKLFGTDFVCIS